MNLCLLYTQRINAPYARLIAKGPSLLTIVGAAVIASILLSPPALRAREWDQAKLSESSSTLNGEKLKLSKVDLSSMWKLTPWLAAGPSLGMSYTNAKAGMYDRYRDLTLLANVWVHWPLGKVTPFLRLGVNIASYVQMEGNLSATVRHEGEQIPVELNYSLVGQKRGYEWGLGTQVKLSQQVGVFWEYTVTKHVIAINRADINGGFSTTDQEITLAGRPGLTLKESEQGSPVKLAAKRSRHPLAGHAMAVGIAYRIAP